jgi:lipopolysaccharide transport system ATP-binding protein
VSETAIRVENLSKRYFIRHQRPGGEGLRHVLQEKLTAPFRWMAGKRRAESGERRKEGGSEGTGGGVPNPESRLPAPSPAAQEEFWALRDVSFEIRQGEVVGVVGRNGAGKSTLLKILSRITEPTSGRITIEGRVASLLEVGTGFHPELTGRENIFLNGAILGMSRVEIRRKFDEIVAFAEVEKFLDTPVKRYSSGMYVRLAFAVAAHLESKILLIDEVLAVGDAEFQRKCLGKMSTVARDGRTVLFVSHNAGAVATLCSKGILMEKGGCAMVGRVRDVLHFYNAQGTRDSVDLRVDASRPCITRVSVDQGRLRSGDLDMEVAFVSPFPLNPPIVGVVISDLMGIPVFGTNTLMHGEELAARPMSRGSARVAVDALPLHPGEYRATVFLAEAGRQHDCQRDVVTFDFMPRKPVVNCPPVESIGPLNIPARWVLE